ncbi:MAG: helix-turn-helix domain-containing protein [Bacteroidota bacterium]
MAYKIRLTTEETYLLADYMQAATQKRQSRRLLAISLRHYGYAVQDIAKLTGVSQRTVTNWFKRYLAGGLDALMTFEYPKDRNSRLSPLVADIQLYWLDHPQAQIKDLQDWLDRTHQVQVEHSWLYRYLELHDLLPPYLVSRRQSEED